MAIHALADDDHQTMQWLSQTCPKVESRANIAAFTDRMDASRVLALAVGIDLGQRISKLHLLEVLAPAVVKRRQRLVQRVQTALLGELRAYWEAWEHLCEQDLHCDPMEVMRAWCGPVAEGIKPFRSTQWEQTPREEPLYQSSVETLTALWRHEIQGLAERRAPLSSTVH